MGQNAKYFRSEVLSGSSKQSVWEYSFCLLFCFSFYSQEQPEAVKAGIIFKCESPLTIWLEAGNELLTIFQCKNSIQKVQGFFLV